MAAARGARYRLADDAQRPPLTLVPGGDGHKGGEDSAAQADDRQ